MSKQDFKSRILHLALSSGSKNLEEIKHIRTEMVETNVWREECPVPLDRLCLVEISYYNFKGLYHEKGEMIVLDTVAESVVEIFKELFIRKFPINKIHQMNTYKGSDILSMEDNNTTCFNCRKSTSSDKFSMHAYGLAIDINPIQNPYVEVLEVVNSKDLGVLNNEKLLRVMPSLGFEYINREEIKKREKDNKPMSFGATEEIVDIFYNNGFTIWGGGWISPIDWHHFEVPRSIGEYLLKLNSEDAKKLFSFYVANPSLTESTIKKMLNMPAEKVMDLLESILSIN